MTITTVIIEMAIPVLLPLSPKSLTREVARYGAGLEGRSNIFLIVLHWGYKHPKPYEFLHKQLQINDIPDVRLPRTLIPVCRTTVTATNRIWRSVEGWKHVPFEETDYSDDCHCWYFDHDRFLDQRHYDVNT